MLSHVPRAGSSGKLYRFCAAQGRGLGTCQGSQVRVPLEAIVYLLARLIVTVTNAAGGGISGLGCRQLHHRPDAVCGRGPQGPELCQRCAAECHGLAGISGPSTPVFAANRMYLHRCKLALNFILQTFALALQDENTSSRVAPVI